MFLTDKASGLGKHAFTNPDAPNQCWCHMLYGHLPADTYLNVVDNTTRQLSDEELAFKSEDAEAMGHSVVFLNDVKH